MWRQIGVLTQEEIEEAEAKGFAKCGCCGGYKPIMKDDCLCFRCFEHFRKDLEPKTIFVTSYASDNDR